MSLIFKSLKVGFSLEIQAFKREKLVLKANWKAIVSGLSSFRVNSQSLILKQMERVGKQLSRFRVQGTLLWFCHDDATASYSN